MKRLVLAVALIAVVSACDKAPSNAAAPEIAAPMPEKVAHAALKAAGTPEALQPDPQDGLQDAASVVEMTYLQKQGDLTAKIFGTAGGDPAMNGLYTYVAFYVSPADGWRVFKIGDVLEYRILTETPGRIDLELKESVMDDKTGEIGSRLRRVIISWNPGPDGEGPKAVSVTPAA